MGGLADRDTATGLVTEAELTLYRLETAWPALAAATVPGRTRRPGTGPKNTLQRVAALREHLRDRRAAFQATQARRVPSGPKVAAAVIGPVSVRRDVADMLARLAERLWTAYSRGEHEWPVFDHATVRLADICPHCDGTGVAKQPRWWPADRDWPPRPRDFIGPMQAPRCLRCHQGVVTAVATVSATDQLVHAALGVIAEHLPRCVDSPERAGDALRTLDRADQAIRVALGAGEDRRILTLPCPVCDTRGSLYAEVSSPDRRGWVIRCSAPDCTCTGRDCYCARPVRLTGRRHSWPAAEWNTPGGLADLLGADLPPLLFDAEGRPVRLPPIEGPTCDVDDDGYPCDVHESCDRLHRQGVTYRPPPAPGPACTGRCGHESCRAISRQHRTHTTTEDPVATPNPQHARADEPVRAAGVR